MELNLRDTELRLGLPGSDMKKDQKRILGACMSRSLATQEESTIITNNQEDDDDESCPPAKVQVVGWPPIRSYRKNVSVSKNSKVEEKKGNNNNKDHQEYVKVSMDGAPYLRKIHLKLYNTYPQLLNALQTMFNCTFGQYSEREGYDGSEFVPTYEDKDGDWMLVGDVPWNMFMLSCKRLRIMKGSEAKGLGCL